MTGLFSKKKRILFSIQDTGIGIKEEDRDKLFKMFGRLENDENEINS